MVDISKEEIIEVLKFAARSVAAPEPVEMMPRSMLILFDHSTPAPYRPPTGHTVTTARDRVDRLSNGDY